MANPGPFRLLTDEQRAHLRMPCFVCGKTPKESEAQYFCPLCKLIPYCSVAHQQEHWNGHHKRECEEELKGDIYPSEVRRYFEISGLLKRGAMHDAICKEANSCQTKVLDYILQEHLNTMSQIETEHQASHRAKKTAHILRGVLDPLRELSQRINTVLGLESKSSKKSPEVMTLLHAEVKSTEAYTDAYMVAAMNNPNKMPTERELAVEALVNLAISNGLTAAQASGTGSSEGGFRTATTTTTIGMLPGVRTRSDDDELFRFLENYMTADEFFDLIWYQMTHRTLEENQYVFKDEWDGAYHDWFIRRKLDVLENLRASMYTKLIRYFWRMEHRTRLKEIFDAHFPVQPGVPTLQQRLASDSPRVRKLAKAQMLACWDEFIRGHPYLHHIIGSVATLVFHVLKTFGSYLIVKTIVNVVTGGRSVLLNPDNQEIERQFLNDLNIPEMKHKNAHEALFTAYSTAREIAELKMNPGTAAFIEGTTVADQISKLQKVLSGDILKATQAINNIDITPANNTGWGFLGTYKSVKTTDVGPLLEAMAKKDVVFKYHGAAGALFDDYDERTGLGPSPQKFAARIAMLVSPDAVELNALTMAQYGPVGPSPGFTAEPVSTFQYLLNYMITRAVGSTALTANRAAGFYTADRASAPNEEEGTPFDEAFSGGRTVYEEVRTWGYGARYPKRLFDLTQHEHYERVLAHKTARDKRIWQTMVTIAGGALAWVGLNYWYPNTLSLAHFTPYMPYVVPFISFNLIPQATNLMTMTLASTVFPQEGVLAANLLARWLQLSFEASIGLYAACGLANIALRRYFNAWTNRWMNPGRDDHGGGQGRARRGTGAPLPLQPQPPGVGSQIMTNLIKFLRFLVFISAIIPILAASGIHIPLFS